jgi:hypothetical protein
LLERSPASRRIRRQQPIPNRAASWTAASLAGSGWRHHRLVIVTEVAMGRMA